jgi:hypothetical protein
MPTTSATGSKSLPRTITPFSRQRPMLNAPPIICRAYSPRHHPTLQANNGHAGTGPPRAGFSLPIVTIALTIKPVHPTYYKTEGDFQ